MRFLFAFLSIIWLTFGWVSLEALRWRPPLPPPAHAERALQSTSPQQLTQNETRWNLILQHQNLSPHEQAFAHFRLATVFWIRAYIVSSRPQQLQMLQKSLEHCFAALENLPGDPHYLYCTADIYHQMGEYDQAEKYYQRALSKDPGHQLARIRYQQLKQERTNGK